MRLISLKLWHNKFILSNFQRQHKYSLFAKCRDLVVKLVVTGYQCRICVDYCGQAKRKKVNGGLGRKENW
jgi:hypothetical protein